MDGNAASAGPLRVAVVGTGYFSRFHYRAWRRMADVELVALHAEEAARGAAVAAEHGVPRVFDDVARMLDATRPALVDLVTPPPSHAPLAALCIERGIPVVCQKPFCTDLDAALALVRRAEAGGGLVVVHENFRFQPWYREIRRLLESGALGEPYGIRFDLRPGDGRGADAYLGRQPYFREQRRFLIRETAVHLVDTFRFLLGEIETVAARLARLNPAIRGEDAALVVFGFESGATGLFDGNRLVDHPARNPRLTMGELRLEGSRATLGLDGEGRLTLRAHGERHAREHAYAWRDVDFGGDCVHATCRHIADHLLHGAPLENRAADYVANLAVEEAIYRAHASGRTETVARPG